MGTRIAAENLFVTGIYPSPCDTCPGADNPPVNSFDSNTDPDAPEDNGDATDLKSKSQVKREMLALTELAARLTTLSDAQRARLPLSNDIAEAVDQARRIPSFGARKRQIKFIGRLLRNEPTGPLAEALQSLEQQDRRQAQHEQRLTRWRDRLLDEGDSAFEDLLQTYPNLDRQHIRQLIRNARQEAKRDKPPASARALLRYLRQETAE